MTAAKYAFTKSLREVRFLFCQTSEQSAAVRSFITRAYPTMKRSNPNIPILIREAAGTQPKVYARYGAYGTTARPKTLADFCRARYRKVQGPRGPVGQGD
ncbi:hypothetical protein NW757_008064 [Fusarium falciforme]|nr:hypothetical protein NW757_008064 [Fusarium falciforme]